MTTTDNLKTNLGKLSGFLEDLDRLEVEAKQKGLPFDRGKMIEFTSEVKSISSVDEAYKRLYSTDIEKQVNSSNLREKITSSFDEGIAKKEAVEKPTKEVEAPTKDNLDDKVSESLKDSYDW